jgi:hypothetical protein
MSRNKARYRTRNAATSAWRRARQAAARMQPAADQVMPVAKVAGAAAGRQANRTRAWAAPQVERAGQVVQDRVAPKVSSLLSAAARRVEPDKPRSPRWRKVLGVSAAAVAASAIAVAVRSRLKASAPAEKDDLAEEGGGPSAAETASAAQRQDGQRGASRKVGQDSASRSSG